MDHQANITESELECMLFDETAMPKPLPFSLLERITNDFSDEMEIGRGGFAVVYKAMLGKGVVAVKRLSNTHMYEKEYLREVECLMKVKHRNIVRFLGYCADTQGNVIMHEGKYTMVEIPRRLLCFEYVNNGDLNRHIKDPSCGLEWIDRYDIIKGICEGLHHLHQQNIVHLDLKPANILMNENMEPKITDFGISRNLQEDQTRIIATKVIGTLGYMAPEFVSHLITKKYDLYSLGVIISEILTGEKKCQDVETVLKSWSARLNISQRNQECEQIRVCVEIAIECTDFNPAKRPVNMKHIIERLPSTKRIEGRKIIHEVNETETIIQFPDGSENAPGSSKDQRSTSWGAPVLQKSVHKFSECGGVPRPEGTMERRETHRTEEEEGKNERERLNNTENLFGVVVDNYKLDKMTRYMGNPKRIEDRARVAYILMKEYDKDRKASKYIGSLFFHLPFGLIMPRVGTQCLFYNATGDTIYQVANQDWDCKISGHRYSTAIGNGQWAALWHTDDRTGGLWKAPRSSKAAVVYRGKNKHGEDQDYLLDCLPGIPRYLVFPATSVIARLVLWTTSKIIGLVYRRNWTILIIPRIPGPTGTRSKQKLRKA